MLDHLPRLRFSNDQIKAILWVMKQCGTPDVPSFYALRQCQKQLQSGLLEPRKHKSATGTEFYVNKPVDIEWANPCIQRYFSVYPEVTDTVSEFWQATKYLTEVSDDQLTPMWANWEESPHRHFYTKEVAQMDSGEYIIPLRWVIFQGQEHAQAIFLIQNGGGELEVADPEQKYVPCSQLRFNFLDLQVRLPNLQICDSVALMKLGISQQSMPNPIRKIANGRPAFCIRLVPWSDDVSGNRSKQYNAHMNVYFTGANIPHHIRAQEYFVHFASTSPDASALEQLEAFVEDMHGDSWHEAYDCQLHCEIIFQIHIHLLAADNPMQAELANNPGSNSRLWCHTDKSGGTMGERESDEGYEALYQWLDVITHKCQISDETLRDPQETVMTVMRQFHAAATGIQSHIDQLSTEMGVKDWVANYWFPKMITFFNKEQQRRVDDPETRDERLKKKMTKADLKKLKETIKHEIHLDAMRWVISQPEHRIINLPIDAQERFNLRPGDHYNPLFALPGFNPHTDTPCEILHTVLLGIDKYMWYETSHKWNTKKDADFASLLETVCLDGLNIHSFRPKYMMQFKNSLIGRQFKSLQQTAVFCLYRDLGDEPQQRDKHIFKIWKATGELGALLWFPEIHNPMEYQKDLEVAIDNVLDAWGLFDPARIQYKLKLHILCHLKRDIKRFGPAILFSTEVFEAWNGIFRACSILSNHHSPSRDIAETLAGMERIKHVVSGGWWKTADGSIIRGGPGVIKQVHLNSSLRRQLGLSAVPNLAPGTLKRRSQRKQDKAPLSKFINNLPVQQVLLHNNFQSDIYDLEVAQCAYTVSQSGDTCKEHSWVFYETRKDSLHAGRIECILTAASTPDRSTSGFVILTRYSVAPNRHVQLNMPVLQRSDTVDIVPSTAVQFIFNTQSVCGEGNLSESGLVINLHALHNAHLLRRALPRHLTQPVPLYSAEERSQIHAEWAAKLRIRGPAKRQAAKEKAAATRAKNKAAES
ncbi:hypothetical protein NP233_g7745 [Leucocoprinus birnbaumii]|uniref:Uncharacterized protein n=1 Tax=Leucocoprinus birnbaumii TaxID=56174 RepID=A0AAD5YUF5_9AGAR|nr:hypothetical protein NP233_g7745 [Leucocoprinus birnbaumii]